MRPNLRTALAALTVAAVAGGGLLLPAGTAAAADAPAPKGDFNGDGFADVVVGAPNAKVGEVKAAGQVVVLYGSAGGVTASKRQLLSQESPGIPDAAEAYEGFGGVSAAGDFDGDGFCDLAVTAHHENEGAGLLTVVWGSKGGLTDGVTLEDPDKLASPGIQNRRTWGGKLAVGDFDGDGKDELVVAASTNATANSTLYTFRNIARSGRQAAPVKTPLGFRLTHDLEGLASGDVDGDGRDDLVLAGAVSGLNHYVPGSPTGLLPGAAKALGAGDEQAVGDINGDGYGDVVIGNRSAGKGGQILVAYGSAAGPSATPAVIDQNTPGVPGASEQGDDFGVSLALGDIDGDGYQDLAVGSYGESLDPVSLAGGVHVFRGSASGLVTGTGVQAVNRTSPGVPGDARQAEQFGIAVTLTDANKDGKADLIVGSGDADGGNSGSVTYLPSNGAKVAAPGSRLVLPGEAGLAATAGLGFGSRFAD
ncbi:FG-GAP-like repeat-containing protein [Streptomyces sp. NBC_00162]|uniref:FG-GAP-like repeat-containing protein n=1 Tax=Streptomyces sp. NBC_00162 TaxID=2903629 RepID=UPI00214C68DF|nr:FG-GAP-like repeat-containing protein [Streptomyces sp. NBC_00162]UUU42226.1 FG-GAP-like repeat-containing protein [Streptomyces sp. NBC_00162]